MYIVLPYHTPMMLVGLEFNGPVNTIKIMLSGSVYLTTLLPGHAKPSKGLIRTCAH